MACSSLYGMGTIVLADSISFEYDNQSATLTVTGTGAMEDYTENTLSSRPWSAYAESAEVVVISDGITHVGDYAFSRFSALNYVEIHESVTSLGTTAFGGNDSLKEIFVPSTVTEIEPYAFGYAYDMTVPEGFIAYCDYKSAAQAYCFKNYIPFDAPMMGRFEDIAWITEAGQQAVWSFYAYSSGTLEFWSIGSKDTAGLIYDASNYVYSTDYSEMKKSAVAYNDDNGSDVNFKITYTVEAGKRYYLAARFMLQNRYDGSNEYEDGRFGVEMRMTCDEHCLESYVRTFPTCTDPGETVEFCLSCDYENIIEIPMIDHDPYPAVREDIEEATCTDDGHYDMVEYCKLCGGEVSRTNYTVDAYGHDFSEYVYQDNATCTEDGTETAYCSRCGLIDTRTVKDSALGHEFNDYISDGNATCTEDGTETAHCARCTETDTRVEQGSAYGHDYEVRVIAPTCTDGGYTLHTCLRCNDSYMSHFQDALGHTDGEEEFEIIVESTCTERGTAHVTVHCTVCGAETFSADRSIDVLGHSFTNYVSNNDADCIHNGSETAKCDRCDETDTRFVENSAYGHEYVTEVVAPTCTDGGHTLHTCTRCNDSYMSDFQDALGHIDGEEEYEVVVPATCTEIGTAHVTVHCTRCGAETFSADRNIDMLGHDFIIKAFDGEVVTTECSRCQEIKTFDFMFRYNTRIVENDDWAIIDVNRDGVINAKDYAYLYRMIK